MKKNILILMMVAAFNPVRGQQTVPQIEDSVEAKIWISQEKIKETEREIKEKQKAWENKFREQMKEHDGRPVGRIETKINGMEDSLLRINIQIGALDSILKNIPIPKNIEINEHHMRILADSMTRWGTHRPAGRTERKSIVKFGEDVIVGRNEVVEGDVVVVDGNAVIYGKVEGGVVVVRGNIRLASTSRVEGGLVCVWGTTDVEPGAHAGDTNVINPGKGFSKLLDSKIIPSLFFVIRLLRTVVLLAMALLICVAFPEPTRRVKRYLEKSYAKSLAAGLIIYLLLPFLFIVLIITILGIPIAVLLLPLAIIGAFLLGITAFGNLAGEWLLERFNVKKRSALLATGVGIVLFEAPSLLGKPLSLLGSLFSVVVVLAGIALFLLVWTPAFGAAVLTRFGKAPKGQSKPS